MLSLNSIVAPVSFAISRHFSIKLETGKYSLGEHIQLGMKSSITLSHAKEGRGGAALGAQNSVNQVGSLIGYFIIVLAFSFFASSATTYKTFFYIATALAAISMSFSLRLTSKSETDSTKRRFYFHKKFTKYYMLEMFYGARKQVFITFGPYVLILFYGADAATISALKVKHRDLQSVTTASLVTSGTITGLIRDSMYIPPDCTVVKTIRCVDISDDWFSLKGCENEKGQFDGEYTSKDSLIIVATVQYKRFLNFLWKTNKVKNREVDIVSKNPHTKITGFEYIEIEK